MNGILSFLGRYKNFIPPSRALEKAVRAALIEVIGLEIPERSLRADRGVVSIALGGVQKSEILLRKEDILRAVRGKIGKGLRDIR